MRRISRVLQIANRAGPLHTFMLPLCRALAAAGIEVELACMPGQASWQALLNDGFAVHALPEGSWASPLTWARVCRAVRSLLAAGSYDLVIVHTPAMSWLVRPVAARHAGITIYFAHGLPFAPQQDRVRHAVYLAIEKHMARYTDGLLVMNTDDAQACQTFRLTRPDGRWAYIPGVGIDVHQWSRPLPEPRRRHWTEELHLHEQKPLVLFLGRFIRAKRPHDVLECAAALRAEADFVMAGEGPLWGVIKRQAARIGPHVHVLEFTPQAAELMMRCDIVILPSVFREGLPRVLLEAGAAAKPVVAYDIRGVRDIARNDRNAYLVSAGDVGALCDAAKRLIRDPSLRDRLGLEGRRIVEDGFTVGHSLAAVMTFINALAVGRGYNPLAVNPVM